VPSEWIPRSSPVPAVAAIASTDTGAIEAEATLPATFDTTNPWVNWVPDNRSVAFLDLASGTPNISSYSVFAPSTPKQVPHFNTGQVWTFAWSPDGNQLAFAYGNNASDVVFFSQLK
jgi:Tol biopolymer transport system component